jgi:amino acid adenylation domain-containing protein
LTTHLLHELLAAAVASDPGRCAVEGQARSVTYRELDASSNRLAHILNGHGVTRGDRVGIALDKSLEAVIAIFAILKTGAAYVPIDPRAPAQRAALIIDNCRLKGLVTTGDRLTRLKPAITTMPDCVVLVDETALDNSIGWADVLKATDSPFASPTLSDSDLAYILYTSGSTGVPKGVMISHRAALSFVTWAVQYFRLRNDDRLANHAPLHFDLSIFDIFAAVAAAATTVLLPYGIGIIPRSLADWIQSSKITVWYSVPSALVQLTLHGALERHAYEKLRLVLFAGEVFPVAHLRRLMGLVPRAAYFNLYGPTETNVCTIHSVIQAPQQDIPIPIGQACANCELIVLGEDGQPVAPGLIGELYVGGPSLMDGYWQRPEETRAALIDHPLHPDSLGRIYRTGDLVRVDDSGNLHFIGRRDSQVKSRGYRIELGDIEAVLCHHPSVAEAVVIARPHEEFGCILHAVISVHEHGATNRAELAAYCASRLPSYMVPANFEFRESLPKTSSGKLDRRALQAGAG